MVVIGGGGGYAFSEVPKGHVLFDTANKRHRFFDSKRKVGLHWSISGGVVAARYPGGLPQDVVCLKEAIQYAQVPLTQCKSLKDLHTITTVTEMYKFPSLRSVCNVAAALKILLNCGHSTA